MDKQALLKTAHLARLCLSEREQNTLPGDLKNILDHFHKISSVNTKGLKPLVHPLEGIDPPPPPASGQIQKWDQPEELLNLSEELLGSEYKVPSVV